MMRLNPRVSEKNIVAAEELAKIYEDLTAADFIEKKRYLLCHNWASASLQDCLSEITGFNTARCSICRPIQSNCYKCIYYMKASERCYHHPSYVALHSTKDVQEMLTAVKARAKYIRKLTRRYRIYLKFLAVTCGLFKIFGFKKFSQGIKHNEM